MTALLHLWKKSTKHFEEKLKEKIQQTLQHIEEVTKSESEIPQEATPEQLENLANQLEKEVDQLTEEIDQEPDVQVRKEKRKQRSACRKPMKEQERSYKKDIRNAKNWTYEEKDDHFICPNGRRVKFLRYMNKKNQSGYIKGNRSFRRFSLRGIDKVHTEFGIVALAHNLLKVASIRQLLSEKYRKPTKRGGEKRLVFLHLFYFRDLLDSPFCLRIIA